MQVKINQHSFNCNRGLHLPEHVFDALQSFTGDAQQIVEQIKYDMTNTTTGSGSVYVGEHVVNYQFDISLEEHQHLLDSM